jgi:hypothetical protein
MYLLDQNTPYNPLLALNVAAYATCLCPLLVDIENSLDATCVLLCEGYH